MVLEFVVASLQQECGDCWLCAPVLSLKWGFALIPADASVFVRQGMNAVCIFGPKTLALRTNQFFWNMIMAVIEAPLFWFLCPRVLYRHWRTCLRISGHKTACIHAWPIMATRRAVRCQERHFLRIIATVPICNNSIPQKFMNTKSGLGRSTASCSDVRAEILE